MAEQDGSWRRCSSCKTPIGFGAAYFVCSVSTCNRGRTALSFCTSSCWDAHLGVVPHRESWALERRAPTRQEWAREQAGGAAAGGSSAAAAREPRRFVPVSPHRPPVASGPPREVLVVITKLKNYVRARAGMNTSDRVVEPLSDALRELCDRAIDKARAEGRKTLLERDFEE